MFVTDLSYLKGKLGFKRGNIDLRSVLYRQVKGHIVFRMRECNKKALYFSCP